MGRRLLQHDDLVALLAERQGRRETAQAAAGNGNAVAHGLRPLSACEGRIIATRASRREAGLALCRWL